MVIQHNLQSQNANRILGIVTSDQAKSAEKLSSGYRINRAGDDAAGLSISEKMRWQIRGLNKASTNCADGISLCQVADGALNETHSVLQWMNEFSVYAATDTLTADDRGHLQKEVVQLKKEIDRIASDTSFNQAIYPLLGSPQAASTTPTPPTAPSAGTVGSVGTVTSTTGNAPTAAKYSLYRDLYFDSFGTEGYFTYVLGGIRWSTDDTSFVMPDNASEQTFLQAFVNAYNNGQLNSLSGSLSLTFNNGTSTVTHNGTLAPAETQNYRLIHVNVTDDLRLTGSQMGLLTDNFTMSPYGHGTGILTADYAGELVGNTALTTAIRNATVRGTNTVAGDAGTASTATLNFGSATGQYLEDNGIILTVGNSQYTFTTGTPANGSQIRVGASDSGSALASAVAAKVAADGNVGASASGGNVTFTEKKQYLDANHYFMGYSGQALTVDLSDNPPQVNSNGGTNAGNGAGQSSILIQAGALSGQTIQIHLVDATANSIGVGGVDISTAAGASAAIASVRSAIDTVSGYRTQFGVMQNRLEYAIKNLDHTSENTSAAESRIRDTDMADEMVAYSKHNVLAQAGTTMLAQANQKTDAVLSLLG